MKTTPDGDRAALAGSAGRAAWALLEREKELASLERLVGDAERGVGRVVLVEGAPGIGKTRLLREGARLARERSVRVLTARGTELERSFPFALVHQLLDPTVRAGASDERENALRGAAALARPVFDPEAGPPEPDDPSLSILHGLYWLIANVAERGPLFMAIDDAHWSDRPSARLLEFLAPRLEGMPVALAVAARYPRASVEPDVLSVLARAPLERLTLSPLSEKAVHRLVTGRLGPSVPDGLAAACSDATKGNPFLVHQLLEEVVDEAGDGNPDPVTVAELGPREVAATALARVERLPGAAALAGAVAVLDDGVDLGMAAELAQIAPGEASRIADGLADALILEPARPLRFAHPIVQAAVYDSLPTSKRSDLHARAARLHEAAGASPETIAAHLVRTEPRGDLATLETLRRAAAASLAGGAPESAIEYLRRAEAEPPPAELRADVRRELGAALMRSGLPEAVDVLSDAFHLAQTPEARLGTAPDLANALMHAGRSAAAVTAIEAVLDEASEIDPAMHARLEGYVLGNAFIGVNGRSLVEDRLTAVAASYRWTGDARSYLLSGPVAWEWALGPDGSADRAGELGERAWSDSWLLETETSASTAAVGSANALWLTGRYAAAEEALSALLADAQRRGSVRAFAVVSANRAYARYLRGWLHEAEADAAAYSHPLAESGWLIFDGTVGAVLGAVKMEQGDLDGAEQAMGPFEPVRDGDCGTTQLINLARAELAIARGEYDRAMDELALCQQFEDCYRGGAGLASLVAWRPLAALAHQGLDERDEARRVAAEQVRLARSFGAPRSLGVALRVRGVVEDDRERATELLEESVAVLASADSQVEYARSLTDLGARLRESGQTTAARERLQAGMDCAHARGATAIAERARTELVAAGARPRRLATSGPGALTASERRVAEMAAAGMTNREIAQGLFVTLRTVEGHLSGAFSKLGIASREELGRSLSGDSAPRR